MSTRIALAYSFLDRYAGLVLNIAASIVIARIMTPAEIGVFSIAMVLLSFVNSVRDMGSGSYIVQEREITAERLRSAWTIQVITGLLLALVSALAAGPAGRFYSEPKLTEIIYVLALNFAISPAGSITYARLMRDMAFRQLAVMRFSSNIVGASVSVFLAYRGAGPISLAYGSVAATLTNAAVATAFRPAGSPWRLGGTGEFRRVLSFGTRISAATITNTLAFATPELFIGKLQGMAAVGMFSRANGLATMYNKLVLDAAQSVAMTTFARQARDENGRVDGYLHAMIFVTALGWAFFGFLAIFAVPILRLLYGPQWDAAAELTKWMALGMAIGLPSALIPTTLTSLGRADLVLRTTIYSCVAYSAPMATGAFLGFEYVGPMFITGNLLAAFLWIGALRSATNISARACMVAWSPSLKLALISLVPSLCIALIPNEVVSKFAAMALGFFTSAIVFVMACYRIKHPMALEFDRLVATGRGALLSRTDGKAGK